MTTTQPRTKVRRGSFATIPGQMKVRGLWISSNHHSLFIPDSDLMGLANDIADHLAASNRRTTYTTSTNA